MPKRPNPFGDPFSTQFKTHVSQKEVDMGVNKEKNMKAVYGEWIIWWHYKKKNCVVSLHAYTHQSSLLLMKINSWTRWYCMVRSQSRRGASVHTHTIRLTL